MCGVSGCRTARSPAGRSSSRSDASASARRRTSAGTSRTAYPGLPEILRGVRAQRRSSNGSRSSTTGSRGPAPGTCIARTFRSWSGSNAAGGSRARRCCRRSTTSCTTASACSTSSASTTRWRSTSPPAKRRHGYYSMPVLHGDRFLARVDPANDREGSRLIVRHVVPEPGVKADAETTRRRLERRARPGRMAGRRAHRRRPFGPGRLAPRARVAPRTPRGLVLESLR